MAVKDDIRAVQQVSTELIFDWWTGNTCKLDGYQVLQYRHRKAAIMQATRSLRHTCICIALSQPR